MSNPLFNELQGAAQPNALNIVQRFNAFRQNFRGDPRQQVQQLLNSGRVTQAQYNAAVQQAQLLMRLLGGR